MVECYYSAVHRTSLKLRKYSEDIEIIHIKLGVDKLWALLPLPLCGALLLLPSVRRPLLATHVVPIVDT